ncbi:MAG: DUF1565 domain-containing protein, partial [Planctomycetes bacterium]|nr:DUF1565 domain-containing protein [Planctomycetota bacterium]
MKRLAIGILVVLVAAIAHAQEVWVDAANGSDTAGVGTLAQPWRTLSFALTQPVTTLHVLPGTYDSALGEHFPIPFLSGVTIVGSGAATTIVRGGPSVAVFQGTFLGRHVPGAARLFGLTLARELGTAAPGVDFTSYLGSSVDVEIGSCVIEGHQDGVRGIAVGREVRIHDCFVRGNGRDGIRIAFTGCLSARTFIERNVVEANSGRGIELESYCEREPADPNFPTTSLNVTVRKNVVRQNDKGIFVLAGLLRTFEGYLSDGEVVGSIDANWIADNVDAGIVLRTEASGRLTTSATNNVLAGNAVGIRTTVSFPNPAILPQLSPLVVNDTIVGNTVAGYAEDSSPRAMSSIVNSIVAGNGDDLLGRVALVGQSVLIALHHEPTAVLAFG